MESVQTIDKTTTQPYEAKIQQIIQYVEKCEVVLKNRAEIHKNYQEDKQNFVLLTMPFDTDFYHNDWFKTFHLHCRLFYLLSEYGLFLLVLM